MYIIDTHCHLNYLDYTKEHKDVAEVIAKAKARGVKQILHVCCRTPEYLEVVEEYSKYPEVFFTFGIHPSSAHLEEFDYQKHKEIITNNPRILAVGEIGLDSYWTKEHLDVQRKTFAGELVLAKELDLPVIVHTRGDIAPETLQMIEDSGVRKGVIHCFTENQEIADRALALGFHIGIGGIATFKNAEELRAVLRTVPVDRILTETDSPYLAPTPHRGKPNQPAYTRDIAEYLAPMYGMSVQEFAVQTVKNAQNLFNLPEVTE